jgi:hypothetical protein
VATYLVHKFAALGYLTAVQKFTPKYFVHAVSRFHILLRVARFFLVHDAKPEKMHQMNKKCTILA